MVKIQETRLMQNTTDSHNEVINSKRGTLSLGKWVPKLFKKCLADGSVHQVTKKNIGEQLKVNKMD